MNAGLKTRFMTQRLLMVLWLSALAAAAHPGAHPEIDGAPTPRPDRVVLTWRGDPATTQAVTWRTDTSVKAARAEIALARERAQRPERTVEARTERVAWDLGEMHYHSVAFEGLEPDTLYAYRVGDGTHWSAWFQFRTASRTPRKFSFIYFGDAQNDLREHWSRVAREAFREAPRAAFTLHAGDLVTRGNSDWEWQEWHEAAGWVNGTIPVVATPGNHEYRAIREQRQWTRKDGSTVVVTLLRSGPRQLVGPAHALLRITAPGAAEVVVDENGVCLRADSAFVALTGYTTAELAGQKLFPLLKDRREGAGVPALAEQWRPQFAFPENGPAGLEETAYYFDYQGVRFVSLNSNEKQAEQVEWLRRVLQENRQRWVIATFHHPLYSTHVRRDNAALRDLWKPVLDEYRVDLVLQGHDHSYARGRYDNLATGINQARDEGSGTVYVISVSGPKMYSVIRQPWMTRAAEDTQLFQVITVDGDELRYVARTAIGRVYDAFTLRKRAGRPNELIEGESLPPEILRPKGANPAAASDVDTR
jgi:3',5'-cyclic AMP phosphodiesterase CpdA